jgi:hypothetical protein
MDKNRDKLSPEDLKRHEAQLKLLITIVATYEKEGDAASSKITSLMTEVCFHSSPRVDRPLV